MRRMFWTVSLCLVLATGCGSQSPVAPTPTPTSSAPVTLAASGTFTASDGGTIAYRSDGQPTLNRPTVFILYGGADLINTGDFSSRLAKPFIDAGWLVVSIDIPGHGADIRSTEPSDGLTIWRLRVAAGEDIAADFGRHLNAAISTLIALKVTDPARIVLTGPSRAGYMALQGAARDPRVRAVAALMPVTDLLALEEFAGLEQNPTVAQLHISRQASVLARVPLWLQIGSSDTRVSTEACVAFVARMKGVGASVSFVLTDLPGHAFPESAYGEAATWLMAR